jgi:signal peptidase II
LEAIYITLIVIFDQITKFFAVSHIEGNGTIIAIPHLLSFRYHENSGAAWGILSDHRWVFMIVSTVAILFIIGLLLYFRIQNIKTSFLLRLSLCFFCGGGIGNMIDRVRLGYVIDFLNFEFIDFPIFNIADSFISIGAGLMVLYLVIDTVREWKQSKSKRND